MLTLAHSGRPAWGTASNVRPWSLRNSSDRAPAIEDEVFVAVVVEVAADRAHGDARRRLVQVGDAELLGHVFEGSVAPVAVEAVLRAFPAVRRVEVVPAVAVEVHHRDRGAHGADLRHDVVELRVEARGLVDEVDSGRVGRLDQPEAVPLASVTVGGGGRRGPGAKPADERRGREQCNKEDGQEGAGVSFHRENCGILP